PKAAPSSPATTTKESSASPAPSSPWTAPLKTSRSLPEHPSPQPSASPRTTRQSSSASNQSSLPASPPASTSSTPQASSNPPSSARTKAGYPIFGAASSRLRWGRHTSRPAPSPPQRTLQRIDRTLHHLRLRRSLLQRPHHRRPHQRDVLQHAPRISHANLAPPSKLPHLHCDNRHLIAQLLTTPREHSRRQLIARLGTLRHYRSKRREVRRRNPIRNPHHLAQRSPIPELANFL